MAILGADVPQIVAVLQFIHEVWASLVDVAIATWLLERKLSLACLAPVVLVLVFIGITTKISVIQKRKQRLWIEAIQERLRTTTSLLGSLGPIKMLGLTDTVSNMIQKLRRDEIKASTAYRKVLLSVLLLCKSSTVSMKPVQVLTDYNTANVPLNLAPTVTFAVYVIISIYWKGTTLEVSQAFSALALISLLTTPVMLFTQVLPRVIQSLAYFNRIQEYCTRRTMTLG